jgi:hypothetical protein
MICYMDTDKFEHQDEWFEQATVIYNILPKHTEYFGDYMVIQTGASLRFSGRYHISEYTHNPEDTVSFTLILSKDPEKQFSIQFNGRRSQYLAKKYFLRSYLENEVIESLYDLNGFPAFLLSLSLTDFEKT